MNGFYNRQAEYLCANKNKVIEYFSSVEFKYHMWLAEQNKNNHIRVRPEWKEHREEILELTSKIKLNPRLVDENVQRYEDKIKYIKKYVYEFERVRKNHFKSFFEINVDKDYIHKEEQSIQTLSEVWHLHTRIDNYFYQLFFEFENFLPKILFSQKITNFDPEKLMKWIDKKWKLMSKIRENKLESPKLHFGDLIALFDSIVIDEDPSENIRCKLRLLGIDSDERNINILQLNFDKIILELFELNNLRNSITKKSIIFTRLNLIKLKTSINWVTIKREFGEIHFQQKMEEAFLENKYLNEREQYPIVAEQITLYFRSIPIDEHSGRSYKFNSKSNINPDIDNQISLLKKKFEFEKEAYRLENYIDISKNYSRTVLFISIFSAIRSAVNNIFVNMFDLTNYLNQSYISITENFNFSKIYKNFISSLKKNKNTEKEKFVFLKLLKLNSPKKLKLNNDLRTATEQNLNSLITTRNTYSHYNFTHLYYSKSKLADFVNDVIKKLEFFNSKFEVNVIKRKLTQYERLW